MFARLLAIVSDAVSLHLRLLISPIFVGLVGVAFHCEERTSLFDVAAVYRSIGIRQ